MSNHRSVALLVLCGIVLFGVSAEAAQNYLMTGKFARSNGPFINIPLIGNNPGGLPNCGRTLMDGKMSPGMTPIVQGFRSNIKQTGIPTPAITMTMFANPFGCVSGMGKIVATAPGTGKAFELPSMAFSRPLPGMTLALSEPLQPNVPQLATSWRITAPPMGFSTLPDPPNGTMNNGMNTAKFRYFQTGAWRGGYAGALMTINAPMKTNGQTGRAGAMFTWCFGNPGCTKVTQAMGVDKNGNPNIAYPVHQLIVKYTPGANKFGGTMSHVVQAGPNPSSLAVTVGGPVVFLGLAGIGEAATGRGYADFLTDALMGGEAFAMFVIGPVYVPEIMTFQNLIKTVMTPVPYDGGDKTVTVNKVFGFPFTTGTVLARNTGVDVQKNALVVTLTGMGYDCVNAKGVSCSKATGMGARNISLVSGGVAGIDTLDTEYPSLNQIFLPEPQSPVPLFAGVLALLGIALLRARRRREG